MAGHRKWETIRQKMSPERRRANKEAANQMEAEMVLAELRKHSGMTQKELADILGVSQPTLSSQEHQDDMEISTLSRLVSAMGGQLELIVHMPKGDIRLTQFANSTSPER